MSLSARTVLAGVLAVQRGLISPEELTKLLVAGVAVRERLNGEWPDLVTEAGRRLNSTAAMPGDDGLTFVTPESRFVIGELLGQSGPAVVWRADDRKLGRSVALKTLREGTRLDQEAVHQFLRAVAVTATLDHPGIVAIHDFGVFADGRPFVVMPVVEGATLAQAIDDRFRDLFPARRPEDDPHAPLVPRPALPFRELMLRFVEVCHALEHAHTSGVVHRNVKPASFILRPTGAVVVGWSLARRTDGFPEELGKVIGTPAYLSPEQARGDHDRVGPASDVYALGATLYEILTGEPPRVGKTVSRPVETAGRGDIVSPNSIDRRVPADLNAVCMKALATDPAMRYESAKALAKDVERWLADETVLAATAPGAVAARRWAKRSWRTLLTCLVLVLTVLLGLSLAVNWMTKERADTAQGMYQDLSDKWDENQKHWLDTVEREQEFRLALIDSATLHNKTAETLIEVRKYEEARKQLERVRRLCSDPSTKDDPRFEPLHAVALNNLGDLERQAGRPADARRHYNAAKTILLGSVSFRAQDPACIAELARTYGGLAECEKDDARRIGLLFERIRFLLRFHEYRIAAEGIQKLGTARLTPEQQYELACALCRCAEKAGNDSERPLAVREKTAESWSRQTIDLLRAAQGAGLFKDERQVVLLKEDPDLDILRARDDFKRWLADVEAPQKKP